MTEENFNLPMTVLSGSIPTDLNGLFLRVGPNMIKGHNYDRRAHFFDGHGMIHSVYINNQSALYSNQYINTFRYNIECNIYNRNKFFQFGEFSGLLGLLKILVVNPLILNYFKKTDPEVGQANTAIIVYNNKIYAAHEASYLYEIQWSNSSYNNKGFKSIGYDKFNNKLTTPINAHGKVCACMCA